MADVLICTAWNSTTNTCDAVSLVPDVYLFSSAAVQNIDLLLNGGFDRDSFGLGFVGFLSLFAIGLATGLVVSQIRKLR
ncbi:hypothetical protein [Marinobacterium halophilum]|uniref:hypothetical protein n=1 Tax=Marinobacterium halophilum TaxID=267374 RepID=UPI0011B209D1|nr:hypothetical protein [Marinobacterium halophilum]